jgi:DNA-binding response OmpR family regulator
MNKRILIVERDREIAEKLHSLLFEEGYSTYKADSEQEIYIAIEQFDPSLILMDQTSGGIGFNGEQICRRLAAGLNKNVPVVILSERTVLKIKQSLKYSLFSDTSFNLHYIVRQINSCMQIRV